MELDIPSWFRYRQGKAEKAADNCFKLTAPLLDPYYIRVRQNDQGRWIPSIANAPEGEDSMADSAGFDSLRDAWRAAFELYRHVALY
jgi:hypothetical protein